MWRHRKIKDYLDTEKVEGQVRDCISKKSIKDFLDRLCLAEAWLLRHLLGEGQVVRAAALNVKVSARRNDEKPEKFFGDLYLVQNTTTRQVSFRLYCPRENRFVWSSEKVPDLEGYINLKCNTHVLHLGTAMHTFRFPDKRERVHFVDNLNKFLFQECSTKK